MLLTALAGCGGSNSQAGQVETIVDRWQLAVANRHVGEACSLLDEKGLSMMKRELAGFVAAHETGSTCPALMGFLHDAIMTPVQRDEFRTTKASEASVTGDTARVRVNGIYSLARANGGWRISEVPITTSK